MPTVDGRFTHEGISISVYGEDNEVIDEIWYTWDEVENMKGVSQSDFTFEL